jgi:hypothetical protein
MTMMKAPWIIQVWRGTAYERSIRGISWTTDRGRAEWFARRLGRRIPLVAVGTVARKDVMAVFLGREESEIISLRVKIEKVTPLGTAGHELL